MSPQIRDWFLSETIRQICSSFLHWQEQHFVRQKHHFVRQKHHFVRQQQKKLLLILLWTPHLQQQHFVCNNIFVQQQNNYYYFCCEGLIYNFGLFSITHFINCVTKAGATLFLTKKKLVLTFGHLMSLQQQQLQQHYHHCVYSNNAHFSSTSYHAHLWLTKTQKGVVHKWCHNLRLIIFIRIVVFSTTATTTSTLSSSLQQ